MAEKKSPLTISMGKSPKSIREGKAERSLRKHVRALFCVMTKYVRRKNLFVFSDNISMGGVFLETFHPLPLGTRVTLRFPLRSSLRPIEIGGKVVWNRNKIGEGKLGNKSSGMAIAFESVKNSDRKFLKEFLDHTISYGWFLE